jgi:DNA polymerase III subunit gamma/tau
MSYQVLARKYRPRSFDTLVGQEHVVRALTHALEQKRLHHAYLFTGTRGVGKTTLSRILAKSFNCESGITARPCGMCDACCAIDAGRFVDYIEMDAASNRGVDEMAQLLEQAVYAPSNARFKVYMIDEVHMLTNHAFNSMLKTLEEPPEHVKFILATTDPQKIPVTVLSRCLQFNLKQMPPAHIIGHLEYILAQEGVAFESSALRLLAKGAHGSMRDALSLTDQAIAYAAGEVTLDAVQGMLGALDQSYLVRVLDALAAQDGATLLDVCDEITARSLSYSSALQDLGSLLHCVALAQTVPSALADDLPERAEILRLAEQFDPEEVQLFYQIAVLGRNELGLAPDEYAGFSMALLRMLAFRPEFSTAAPEIARARTVAAAPPAQQSANASARAASNATPATRRTGGASPARAALDAARGDAVKTAMPAVRSGGLPSPAIRAVEVVPPWMDEAPPNLEGAMPDVPDRAAQKKTEANVPPNAPPPTRAGMANVAPAVATELQPSERPLDGERVATRSPVAALNWDGDWPALAARLPLRGVVQQLAQQSELAGCEAGPDGAVLVLRVPVDSLRSASAVEKLEVALSGHFGKTIRVTTEIGLVRHTANAAAVAERAARQSHAEMSLSSDPFVQSLMREFGATIVPGSIRPV